MRQKDQGTATKMFKILFGLSNILNITKENSGRNIGRNRGGSCGRRSTGQWVAARWQPTAATAGAGNGGGSKGSARADNQKAVVIAAETVLVVAEMAAAVAEAAAKAKAAMAVAMRQPWQRLRRRQYLHKSPYRCDNNYQRVGKTIKCFAKHFIVLSKPFFCFQSVGPVC